MSVPPSRSGSRDFYRLGREMGYFPPFGVGSEPAGEGEAKRMDAFVTSVWASKEDLARENRERDLMAEEGWLKGIRVKREIEMGSENGEEERSHRP